MVPAIRDSPPVGGNVPSASDGKRKPAPGDRARVNVRLVGKRCFANESTTTSTTSQVRPMVGEDEKRDTTGDNIPDSLGVLLPNSWFMRSLRTEGAGLLTSRCHKI